MKVKVKTDKVQGVMETRELTLDFEVDAVKGTWVIVAEVMDLDMVRHCKDGTIDYEKVRILTIHDINGRLLYDDTGNDVFDAIYDALEVAELPIQKGYSDGLQETLVETIEALYG